MISVWTCRSSHNATARITDYNLGVCIIRTRDIKSTSISVKLSLFECFIFVVKYLCTFYFMYIFNLFLFCSTAGRISLFLNDRLLVVNNCSREQSSLRKIALLLLWYQNWCASCPWSTSSLRFVCGMLKTKCWKLNIQRDSIFISGKKKKKKWFEKIHLTH